MKRHKTPDACSYCEGAAEGNYTIHRDGFGEGPEVPLCDACGSRPEPTCEAIWERIAVAQPKEKPAKKGRKS